MYTIQFLFGESHFIITLMSSHSQPIVMVLSDVLRGTEKEKVKRIALATLRVCV